MAINTYKTLSDSLKSWSKRTELDPVIIADLVKMTEIKIDVSDLRLSEDEDTEEVTLQTNDNYLALPPRFKAMRSIRIEYGNTRKHLNFVTPGRLQYTSNPGFPKNYTITNTIEFDRKPDQNYKVFVDHYQTLEALDSSDPDSTNTILQKYPIIYIYGALEEVFNYVLDEKRASSYRQKFYAMINMANQMEEAGRFPAVSGPTPPSALI